MKKKCFDQQQLLLQWLKYIKVICIKKYNNSIDNVQYIAKKLNLIKWSAFIITVSGTNGKGSTSTVLESIFLNMGHKVGLYSSPHLFNYYERIRVNGRYIKDPIVHIMAFQRIVLVSKHIPLSYFEFITLAALLIFQCNNLNIIIMEVGLGGRLDATNIIDASIAIITNIDLEHTYLLGCTRYSIGYEKSGIFRNNIIAIVGDNDIPYSIYQTANILKVCLNRIKYEWYWFESKYSWYFADQKGILSNLPVPKISLPSAAIAVAAVRTTHFNISKKIIIRSLNEVFLPGRFHTIYQKPRIIVDVAHNAHATHYLSKKLKRLLTNTRMKIYGIFGILSDKDIRNTVFHLMEIIDYWYYTILNTNRTATANNIMQVLPKNAIFSVSIKDAIYDLIYKVQKEDIILVFGSFFAVSEAMTAIRMLYDQV
ncbi:Dihydrofolate synthase/folylpolyglutamate synthase [Buchnera aphidicola (Takecallis arundicolens)]|uniref:bifunctional tetrahydrofolate synthase/dihydrofolate synthase n=1 Tax=Buchnera aphidicola TaxID=9 RepID=UPI003464AEFE